MQVQVRFSFNVKSPTDGDVPSFVVALLTTGVALICDDREESPQIDDISQPIAQYLP